ncbi:VCBS repeat-containing protein [Fulvivirgaceae bacterium BMA10]|uniref:VCBS repeat-containing protein n=1 Tax=Splendidivirga corallicola TaxID=3051826 RepID=A0ABT8KKP5_9BACT|nr:VCBS repeat-containing protein [Fulvivirgaceae bacterium BMA10]
MKHTNILILVALVILHIGCNESIQREEEVKELFTLLDSSRTGLDFANFIEDKRDANVLIYESFYDGGGVSLGDINNDGLLDVYLSGNQVGDRLYLNEGNLRFKDITNSAGIKNIGSWSAGVTMADINNDGWLDIYVCKTLYDDSPELRANELYINNGDMTFTESGAEYGLNNYWRSMHATFFDYDRDQDLDMFLVNQPPNPGYFSALRGHDWLDTLFSCRLYENLGNKFEDVTKQANVSNRGYGLSVSTADFNNDGWTDLYVCNDYDSPDFLYINNGDGTFSNKINDYVKHISYFSMGSDVGDINNDGLSDVVVVDMVAEDNYRLKANMGGMEPEAFWNIVNAGGNYQYMFNTLQLNNGVSEDGSMSFSEIGQMSGISSTDWSWTPLLADFDNDGFKDLFVTNGLKKDLRNTDATKNVDAYLQKLVKDFVAKNPNAGDVDLWDIMDWKKVLDFIPSQKIKNYVYQNNGQYGFEKKIDEWGFGQETFSNGAAYGDLDNDGDLDLVVNNVDDVVFLYENNSNKLSEKKNYLRIKLQDGNKEHSFFGTKVWIKFNGLMQYAEVGNAKGFFSSSEDLVHFGVGNADLVEEVKVVWLDGEVSVVKDVQVNQILSIDKQGSSGTSSKEEKTVLHLFADKTGESGVNYFHEENEFDDYDLQVLLPHKMSNFGPALDVGDINGDGLEDFVIGAAAGSSAAIYVQQQDGTFRNRSTPDFQKDAKYEDVGASLYDADNDGDLDLYMVSGGNAFAKESNMYTDRLYLNDGNGSLKRSKGVLPALTSSGSKVLPADFDSDGDLDLFVAGLHVPGEYPSPASSFILKNEMNETGILKYTNVTKEVAPGMIDFGMVTDGVWSDFDQDNDLDLVLTGLWIPVTFLRNDDGVFNDVTEDYQLDKNVGWWFSIEANDIDNDGDEDYLVGNLGLNSKYKASEEEPFTVHYYDFDENGSKDIVLGYYNFGIHFPVRGRSCSSEQVPKLKESFPSYHTFASATLSEVYGDERLEKALNYEAHTFASALIENKGNGKFESNPLPIEAQFSTVNSVVVDDFDLDGQKDIVIAGNLYPFEVETTRADAGLGLFMRGTGSNQFESVPMMKSGLFLPYDVRALKEIQTNQGKFILVASNNDHLRLINVVNNNVN